MKSTSRGEQEKWIQPLTDVRGSQPVQNKMRNVNVFWVWDAEMFSTYYCHPARLLITRPGGIRFLDYDPFACHFVTAKVAKNLQLSHVSWILKASTKIFQKMTHLEQYRNKRSLVSSAVLQPLHVSEILSQYLGKVFFDKMTLCTTRHKNMLIIGSSRLLQTIVEEDVCPLWNCDTCMLM